MFLPLLETADAKMLGMLVQVYTTTTRSSSTRSRRVLRNQTSLDFAFAATEEQLMLQTSEGPARDRREDDGRGPPAQRRARPTRTAANPVAKPVVCE